MHKACSPSHHCAHLASTRAASWRLPWSCCNPLLCVCSVLQLQQSPKLDGSARVGLTAAPQAKCESSRLHDCSIVGRSLHAPLQRLCSTAAKWRARDAMWPAYYAVLAIMPYLLASHGSYILLHQPNTCARSCQISMCRDSFCLSRNWTHCIGIVLHLFA